MKKNIVPVPLKFINLSNWKGGRELYVNTQLIKEKSHKSLILRADFFSICLVANGKVNFVFDFGKKKKLQRNDLMILSPSTILQHVSENESLCFLVVAFTSRFLTQVGISKNEIELINFLVGQHSAVISLNEDESKNIAYIIENLERKNLLKEQHPYSENILIHWFHIFLFEIAAIRLKYKIDDRVQTRSHKQNLVVKFGGLVDQLINKERSIKYYASRLAITPKYLTELVHEVTGRSAGKLINEKLVRELKLQLSDPKLTIEQIAEIYNFSSQSTMGKFFKRHTGMSPSQFRSSF